MTDVLLPAAVGAQIDYHLEIAIDLVANGEVEASAAELALVRTLLRMHGVTQSDLFEELPRMGTAKQKIDQESLSRTTQALARELQAHFVSEGQRWLAELYEQAATEMQRAGSANG